MITARNYAAQAVNGLRKNAARQLAKRYFEEHSICLSLAKDIEKSIHFAVPDNGIFFDNNCLRGIENKNIMLPFDQITVEYFTAPKEIPSSMDKISVPITKNIVLAKQEYDGIRIVSIHYVKDDWWAPSPIGITISENWDELCDVNRDSFTIIEQRKLCPNITNEFAQQGIDYESDMMASVAYSGKVILSLIEALYCKNVSTGIFQDNSKSNNKRIKKGKLPFYETKILLINTGEANSGKQRQDTGTHASPRQHLRMGHIRRLPSGNYWVNSCVVGDPLKGRIDKKYAII